MHLRFLNPLVFILLLLPNLVYAQSDVQLISTDETIQLSSKLKVLREADNQLSLYDVKEQKSQFIWHPEHNQNYGFSHSGVWLYTSLNNVTDINEWVIDLGYAQLDKVDIYVISDDKLIAQTSQGKLRANAKHRFPTLNVSLPYAQPVEIFIRIESQHSSLIAPIDIQTAEKHANQLFFDNLFWGVFYGGLLMLALYNLMLFIWIKDTSLFAFIGYTFAIVIWQFVWGGHVHQVVSPGISIWICAHTDLIFVILGVGSGLFTINFLEGRHNALFSCLLIRTFLGVFIILALLSIFNILDPIWLMVAVLLTYVSSTLIYTYAGFESRRKNIKAAVYFIVAWLLFDVCMLVGLGSLLSLYPSNIITAYAFQVGLFSQAGLFSLALVSKSRHKLEEEIEEATDDLRNNIELVEEQNVRLDIARKDAIEASHVKSQFLANMSHEIRTPLNAILGFSKELHSESLPPERQEQVSIINAAADNLLSIVNDVLDFSKIEAKKLKINNHPFSPTAVLEDMVSIMAKSAHLKNLEFIYDADPLPEKLIGDSYRIKQILNNLLGNALKFTDHGYIKLSAVGSEKAHGIYELVIQVEDSGIGISREDQRKLFAAFSQVEDALNRSYQGTGLGLVICQELVNLMRGELTLSSAPGIGSTFTVTLRTNLLNRSLSLNSNSDWEDKNILYFDPYPQARHAAVKLLKNMGVKVTGVESLLYLRQLHTQYDFVFISVPNNKENILPSILEATRHLNTSTTVMLYSGEESLSKRDDLSQYFTHKIRLPLTLRKLNSLLHVPEESPTNKLQQRLEVLPAAKVLAVDDMEINLRLLTTWLKNTNLQLTLAFSGNDAVEQCKETEFDLILMDVQMPNMDGLEATKLIRQTKLNLGTPIIAVTAHAFKEEQDKLLASGMDDYLPKPINLSDLIDLIKRWCQIIDSNESEQTSFDWELALKRTNQNEDAARDILQKFVQQLPELTEAILASRQEQMYEVMLAKVHQLHGACCYTGVPALHSLCEELESALKIKHYEAAFYKAPELKTESLNILLAVEQAKVLRDIGPAN
ncbi:MAG: 7TM diverse intracellular signaling domain-containing protein [Paraglaciecola sp.]|uniref:7TM diverse intracellular signaling domain-containing protein n=3 Tax=Paraglaciecola sp. TaxID=1920173 RepID=UPI0032661297